MSLSQLNNKLKYAWHNLTYDRKAEELAKKNADKAAALAKQTEAEKKKGKELKEVKQVEDHVQLSLDDVELKDVIVTVSEKPSHFRDPKEIKEFQKAAIEAKHKENEAAGLEPSHFLTKENLKQWIEKEGRTYAWVAREKAGCAETQVAATAQMMGIKSAISKKRGMIMGSR